jgi:hypothetical protein
MSRNCGYCREAGHQKPKCPLFMEHRRQVLTHVPAMRKKVLDAFVKSGFGVGVIFEWHDTYENTTGIAMIQDYSFIGGLNFMTSKNVKYSKQVRLTAGSLEDYYGTVYFPSIAMWDGISQKRNMSVPYAQLRGLEENKYNRHRKILSPSYDYPDFDPALFIQNIRMPARLVNRPLTGDEKWADYVLETGIMPPL